MIIESGKIINERYKVLNLLGQGGMGFVYKVYDFVENRIVALKMIKKKIFSSKAIVRFKNEFTLAINLNHPNIIKVYDLDTYTETETYFFTMECIEGNPLTDYFQEMSEYEKFDVMLKLAKGLNYIHNRHIIHFDVKPDNIYLIPTDEGYIVKLMDFGLASLLEEFGGKVRGTLSYIAPEVMLKKEVDYRVDLYSTGMVLYHIFSNKLPFEKNSTLKEIAQSKTGEVFLKEEAFLGLENDFLKNLITDLCRFKKEDRIQSAYQLMGYLETALELNTREKKSKISDNFNDKYFDRKQLLGKIKTDYLNFCLRGEKRAGKLTIISGEKGSGKSALLKIFSIEAQLNRLPVLYINVDHNKDLVNVFFRKMIFGLIAFSGKSTKSNIIFENARKLIDENGNFCIISGIVLKIKSIIKDIFENIPTKRSIIILVDNLEHLSNTDYKLFQFILHQMVTAPIFLILTANIDQIDGKKIENSQDIFYLFPPEEIDIKNLSIKETESYLSLLLNVSTQNLDKKLLSIVMKECSGNIFLIRNYIEFLIKNSFLFIEDGKYIFNYFSKVEYFIDMNQFYDLRLTKLPEKVIFLLLTILKKLNLNEPISIFSDLFKIENIELLLNQLQEQNFLEFTTIKGIREYSIKNKNVENLLNIFFDKQDLTPYYTIMVDFFSKMSRKSVVKFAHCFVRSNASYQNKEKVLLKTIEYCRLNFKEQDLCDFLVYYYDNFNFDIKEKKKRLKELYYILIWIGKSKKAFKYYKEMLKLIKTEKNKLLVAEVLVDVAYFGNKSIAFQQRLIYLEQGAKIFLIKKDYNNYFRAIYNLMTVNFRLGHIEKCLEIINTVKHLNIKDKSSLKVSEKLMIFSSFMLSPSDFKKSNLYSKLIKLYNYLDADHVVPGEDLNLIHIVVIEQILSGNKKTALNTVEIYIKQIENKKNQISEISLYLIHAYLLEAEGYLKKAFKTYIHIEKILESSKSINGILLLLVDKIRIMINLRINSELIKTELKKALTIAKNLNNYEILIALYSLQVEFMLYRGEWREVDLTIKFCLNILSETKDVYIIKNFIFTACFYYYIIKDGESFFSLMDKLSIALSQNLENDKNIKQLFFDLNLLFNLPSKNNLEQIQENVINSNDRPFILLALFKILNNSWEGHLKTDPVYLLRLIRKGKERLLENPVFVDYLRSVEFLIKRSFNDSLGITAKLGKKNYRRGYIFDCYMSILSSNFYFKSIDEHTKARFFEEKLIKLNNKLSARLPFDKRNNFTQKYWVY